MPMQQTKSSLLAMLGDKGRKAHEQHKKDDIQWGFVNLPPGITGGVAQLKTAKWDVYKPGAKYAGKPFVFLRGTAVRPVDFNGERVFGKGVSITLPLCDTPDKTRNEEPIMFDDNYATLLNEFKKFGIEMADIPFESLEAVLHGLQEQQPYFSFSTRGWTPPPTPQSPHPTEMVFTQFDGQCMWSEEDDAQLSANGMKDSSVHPATTQQTNKKPMGGNGTSPATNPVNRIASTTGKQAVPTSGKKKPAAQVATPGNTTKAPHPIQEQQQPFNEFTDFESLVQAADGEGNEEAMASLRDMATAAGIDEEVVNESKSWAQVAEMIQEAQSAQQSTQHEQVPDESGQETGTEGEQEFVPEEEQVWYYFPMDPRTKRKSTKKATCSVTCVDAETKTVTLKNTATKTVYKNIPWADLVGEE